MVEGTIAPAQEGTQSGFLDPLRRQQFQQSEVHKYWWRVASQGWLGQRLDRAAAMKPLSFRNRLGRMSLPAARAWFALARA